MNENVKPSIAHLVNSYLRITEAWMYSQLKNIKAYDSIIIAQTVQNTNLFPLDNVYCTCSPYRISRFINYVYLKSFDSYPQGKSKEIINQHKVKLLHAHFGPEGVYNLKLKTSLNLPMITTFYGYDMSRLARIPYWQQNYKRLFNTGELFLVCESSRKKKLIELGCPEDRIIVQHLGVDLDKLEFKSRKLPLDNNITILMVGRFTEKKGISYGIQAFAKVAEKHHNLRLRIIGDGELRSSIQSLISELNLASSIDLLGYLPYDIMVKELYASQILMAPSITAQDGDSEGGAPTVITEAQSTGLPVISSYHADIPEAVSEGKSALLSPEKDVNSLAEHLLYLVESPDAWEKMGRAGRKHIEENYSLKRQSNKLEEIYSLLL